LILDRGHDEGRGFICPLARVVMAAQGTAADSGGFAFLPGRKEVGAFDWNRGLLGTSIGVSDRSLVRNSWFVVIGNGVSGVSVRGRTFAASLSQRSHQTSCCDGVCFHCALLAGNYRQVSQNYFVNGMNGLRTADEARVLTTAEAKRRSAFNGRCSDWKQGQCAI
jgi:hypothetical protein